MLELPIILDNLIDEELQNQIEDSIFDCFWKYSTDNTFGSKTLDSKYRNFLNPLEYDISPTFITNFLSSKNRNSFEKILPLIKRGCNEINFDIQKIERCIGAIHALMRKKVKNDYIHINRHDPHLVMLYYVNDSDGDTIIYDKKIEDVSCDDEVYCVDEYYKLKVAHKISPKKGRILFFDGRFYHASSTPTKSIRCIITLDLFGKFGDGSYDFSILKDNIEKKYQYQYH